MTQGESKTSKRDQLVDIASSLFYEQGFGATGIKQIIESAGIAKGTFYSHFSSKEEIGVAWLQKRHETWNRWLHDSLATSKTARGKLLALFDFLESWMTETRFRGCAFLNTLSEIPNAENPMRREIETHKQGLRDLIESLVKEHNEKGQRNSSSQKANVIFLLFEGALVEAQNFQQPWPISAAKREVKSMLAIET